MLTYDLTKAGGTLYEFLYDCIKTDIKKGRLAAKEKMPSKRMLAKNLGVSTITVENAYEQLICEGYLISVPRCGYYVEDITGGQISAAGTEVSLNIAYPESLHKDFMDLSSNKTDPATFPFSIWAKLTREVLSSEDDGLLGDSTCGGVRALREAIGGHLASFRGMFVDPDQIVIGAGTEYLYGLLIQLLGREKKYCIEDPGHQKIARIYESYGVDHEALNIEEDGMSAEQLRSAGAQIVHLSPTHHFPTGRTMPIKKRYALVAWANEADGRYIIEDDYDSEFRLNGRPIPPLQTIDVNEHVIYMNTFSKSLASTIRISYMVLPRHLANEYYSRLSFYTCTVSNFEQYTLAKFIERGYFEKHINRMRLYYGRKRKRVMDEIKNVFRPGEYEIIENDSGLHFILKLNSRMPDEELFKRLSAKKIHLQPVKDYYMNDKKRSSHEFIINYCNMDEAGLKEALMTVRKEMNREKK